MARKCKMARKYGITPEEYTAMFLSQNGVCAICGTPPEAHKKLAIDHNHITGKVRGLLCYKCNVMLGSANDSIVILNASIDYLKATAANVEAGQEKLI